MIELCSKQCSTFFVSNSNPSIFSLLYSTATDLIPFCRSKLHLNKNRPSSGVLGIRQLLQFNG